MMNQRTLDRLERLQRELKGLVPPGSPFYAIAQNLLEQMRIIGNDIADRQKEILDELRRLNERR